MSLYDRVPTRPLDYKYKNLAKPKEILIDYEYGHIFICDENGKIFDASSITANERESWTNRSKIINYIIPVRSMNWKLLDDTSNLYCQEIEVEGITAADYPIADILLSDNLSIYEAEISAWNSIMNIITLDGKIKIIAKSGYKPDFKIIIKNDIVPVIADTDTDVTKEDIPEESDETSDTGTTENVNVEEGGEEDSTEESNETSDTGTTEGVNVEEGGEEVDPIDDNNSDENEVNSDETSTDSE